MTFEVFRESLSSTRPPDALNPLLQAMWMDAKGNWQAAHEIAQDIHSKNGSWIHAYLHRKEGDTGNAAYWYSRAGRPMPSSDLDTEWEAITTELLQAL